MGLPSPEDQATPPPGAWRRLSSSSRKPVRRERGEWCCGEADDAATPLGLPRRASRSRAFVGTPGPERWCVTRADLHFLRREVWEEIQSGGIAPTPADPFDRADAVYGPTIYTVTEQYIKPVTLKAGRVSWALMRHPRGLQCDLFVTHAWQEGIFEFVDKVLCSWPNGARHAWCCMLANPQNEDISQLLQDPALSPFAKALEVSPRMLVVPNRKGSIYTRLWCAYEAFLAYQWDKVILTAAGPASSRILRALPLVLLLVGAGLAAGFWANIGHLGDLSPIFDFSLYPLLVVSLVGTRVNLRRACNLFGAIWAACYFGILCQLPSKHEFDNLWMEFQFRFSAASIAFFVLSEVDRVRFAISLEEAEELTRGCSGSIRDARCSSATDDARIRAEIEDCVEMVDHTIAVLVRAGVSTANLREAVDFGVDIEGFAYAGVAFCAFLLGSAVPIGGIDGLEVLNSVLVASWLAVYALSATDARFFSYLVLQKFTVGLAWPIHIGVYILYFQGLVDMKSSLQISQVGSAVAWFFVIALSAAEIHRVARIPLVGRGLAQVLVARGWHGLRKVCAPVRRRPHGTFCSPLAVSPGAAAAGRRADGGEESGTSGSESEEEDNDSVSERTPLRPVRGRALTFDSPSPVFAALSNWASSSPTSASSGLSGASRQALTPDTASVSAR